MQFANVSFLCVPVQEDTTQKLATDPAHSINVKLIIDVTVEVNVHLFWKRILLKIICFTAEIYKDNHFKVIGHNNWKRQNQSQWVSKSKYKFIFDEWH